MKLYQTKNTLFYSKPTIVSRLKQLWGDHVSKYGQSPKRIYMTEKEWAEYEIELAKTYPTAAANYESLGYPIVNATNSFSSRRVGIICMLFRGVPVVIKKHWKRMLKRRKP